MTTTNLTQIISTAQKISELEAELETAVIKSNKDLQIASSKRFIDNQIGCLKIEFDKLKGIKGLKQAPLTVDFIANNKSLIAIKIATEDFFNELFCHYVLEEKSQIVPKGVYVAYTDTQQDAENLQVYLSAPDYLRDPLQLKSFNFEKLILLRLELL